MRLLALFVLLVVLTVLLEFMLFAAGQWSP
jgi:hypothetical protein